MMQAPKATGRAQPDEGVNMEYFAFALNLQFMLLLLIALME